ncbi:RNA-binding S4 domain-containing protein [Pediococcus acidilactici]|uniref:RNA-binding S4 domain-containing protein n=1 Tax=Pediococcus acidilactici TaxID=1254 RepID=UPI001D0055D6|nr:RNA-binding S4 domain-containing protein [Pediococcus acidilactici]MCB5723679.1 RNA-binding S4 domain-containing protein [Pediococcus acidilactici]MCB5730175.1 RNA-binding S4 domain-containing protein [Pediococcus acidilactici]MCB5731970.1 RNA-binding S4 domain-containing protein [Pediococcus acidilactici]MCB5764884.1 RNA-binding S4 domain-containing protein [Pediococcus acidilactici]MCB5773909.1 RNA-binding S4 domain-containing protein [Pediococcus acidilactici]
MRLDKFLKVSRIIKRRALAKEVADQGRILIKDKVAKSSSNVVPNDQVEIRFGNKTLVIRVEQLLDTTKKDDAERMYTIISENYQQDFRK